MQRGAENRRKARKRNDTGWDKLSPFPAPTRGGRDKYSFCQHPARTRPHSSFSASAPIHEQKCTASRRSFPSFCFKCDRNILGFKGFQYLQCTAGAFCRRTVHRFLPIRHKPDRQTDPAPEQALRRTPGTDSRLPADNRSFRPLYIPCAPNTWAYRPRTGSRSPGPAPRR